MRGNTTGPTKLVVVKGWGSTGRCEDFKNMVALGTLEGRVFELAFA